MDFDTRPSLVIALCLACAACGARRTAGARAPQPAPSSTVLPGDCADPTRDGVVGPEPTLERADRDLDGDGTAEWVSADRGVCDNEGNCQWNLFSGDAPDGCRRYLGTVAATGIEPLSGRGDAGYRDLRGWWRFGGGRYLVQEYRFRAGSYQLVEALVCRQEGDDRLLCAEERD